jgi:hypothetical protein
MAIAFNRQKVDGLKIVSLGLSLWKPQESGTMYLRPTTIPPKAVARAKQNGQSQRDRERVAQAGAI